MLKTIAYFKHLVANSMIQDIMIQCNQLISVDLGLHERLESAPDLLMVTKNSDSVVTGLLVLNFTVSTKAWEVGVMSTMKKYNNRDEMLQVLINGAVDAIRNQQERELIPKTVWLVKQVRDTDLGQKELFSRMKFKCPKNWMDNALSDLGYVPFDPFVMILMKRVVQA